MKQTNKKSTPGGAPSTHINDTPPGDKLQGGKN